MNVRLFDNEVALALERCPRDFYEAALEVHGITVLESAWRLGGLEALVPFISEALAARGYCTELLAKLSSMPPTWLTIPPKGDITISWDNSAGRIFTL